jgi:ADP-heptose:LPS heptosyltransferase
LVVRVGRVGDMVMATPALSALLERRPEARFTLLTGADGKRVLGNFSPRIEEIWLFNRRALLPALHRSSVRKKIVRAGFDQIYCFESNPSYGALFKGSGAKVYGFEHALETSRHYARKLLDIVSAGVGTRLGDYPLWLPVEEAAALENRRQLEARGVTDSTTLVAFHPTFSGINSRLKFSATGRHKFWPPENFAALAKRLRARASQDGTDLRVVMNLMPDEIGVGDKIAELSGGNAEVFCPAPNFKNYLAFLKRSDLLVSPDTGPMHLAAALDTKIVALFSGKDPADCGPFLSPSKFRLLRAEQTSTPEKGIASISTDAVFAECLDLLTRIPKLGNNFHLS